jgi:hypothetical protein
MSTIWTHPTKLGMGAILSATLARPRWLFFLCFVLCLNGRVLGQAGTQLPGLEGGVGVAIEGGGNPPETASIPAAPASTELTHQFMLPQFYAGEGRGRAETFGGVRPMAVAESEFEVAVTRQVGGIVARATAAADLTYRMRINERRTPPITFQPRLRILAKTRGEVTAEASGDQGYAGGQVDVQFGFGARTFRAFADTRQGRGSDSFDEQFIIDFLRPGDVFLIRLNANVASGAMLAVGAHGGAATALVDPEFSFDEIGFAEYAMQQGFEPFRQADYYEFEFSEGVLVPEPSTVVLAAISLVLAIVWKRRSFLRTGGGRSLPIQPQLSQLLAQ